MRLLNRRTSKLNLKDTVANVCTFGTLADAVSDMGDKFK